MEFAIWDFSVVLGSHLLPEGCHHHWHRDNFVPLRVFEFHHQLHISKILVADKFEGLLGPSKVVGDLRIGGPKIEEAKVKFALSVLQQDFHIASVILFTVAS